MRIWSESIPSNNAPLFLSQAAPSPSFSIAEDELLSAAQIKLRRRWIELHHHRFELLRRRIREEVHRGSETLLAACPRRLVPFSRSKAKLCLPLPIIIPPPSSSSRWWGPSGGSGEVLARSVVGGRRPREAKPQVAAAPLLLQLLQVAWWLSPVTSTAWRQCLDECFLTALSIEEHRSDPVSLSLPYCWLRRMPSRREVASGR
jgi:hypothetical protein